MALKFGSQKINVHEAAHTFEPEASVPTPGAGDARGPMTSVYFRDPVANLVEVSRYLPPPTSTIAPVT